MKIKKVANEEIEKGISLMWKVFQEYVAPDYEKEGIETFYNQFVKGQKFLQKFTDKKETMLGAYTNNVLIGIVSYSNKGSISCAFVDGAYHHMGVGTALINEVVRQMKKMGFDTLKLNASPYAVPFYHKVGFKDIGEQTSFQGIIFTPMIISIE